MLRLQRMGPGERLLEVPEGLWRAVSLAGHDRLGGLPHHVGGPSRIEHGLGSDGRSVAHPRQRWTCGIVSGDRCEIVGKPRSLRTEWRPRARTRITTITTN